MTGVQTCALPILPAGEAFDVALLAHDFSGLPDLGENAGPAETIAFTNGYFDQLVVKLPDPSVAPAEPQGGTIEAVGDEDDPVTRASSPEMDAPVRL